MLKKIDYEAMMRLRPAGIEDFSAWKKLAIPSMIYNPATVASTSYAINRVLPELGGTFSGWNIASTGLSCLAALTALHAGKVIGTNIKDKIENGIQRRFTSDAVIRNSSKMPSKETIESWDGIMLGYRVSDGEPVIVDWEQWMRHCFIVGQSGVGKTVLGEWAMYQQIIKGGGMIFIDGKMDESNMRKIMAMAEHAGRREDVLVINPGNPKLSNTYNPILYGDADEVASRILSLIPSSESSPGSDHYRQSANQAITTVIGAIHSINENKRVPNVKGSAFNFIDLSIILQNEKAIQELESMVPSDSEGGRQFKLWLDQFRMITKDGQMAFDLKKMRDLFGGVGGRMHQFGTGNFGKVTSTYSPEVNLFDVITNNKILYVALPTMGKAEAASNFGKMIVGDYRTAVSWVQGLPKDQRPWPPTLCFFDEAGSYVTQSWSRIFEQARSAHQALVPAVQTLANLDSVSPELTAMVIGNTTTKVMFRLGEADTISRIVELIGKETVAQKSVSFSASEGEGGSVDSLAPENASNNSGVGLGYRDGEVERIKPTTITKMGIGEAVVLYENSKLHHIKIPTIEFSPEIMKGLETIEINHQQEGFVKGLNFYQKADTLLKGKG